MNHARVRVLVMLAVLVTGVPLGGCSFLITGKPNPPPADPGCTTGRFAPIVDIGLSFGMVISTEISAGAGELGHRDDTALAVSVAGLGVAVASAIYGFVRTGDCREAYAEYANRPMPMPPMQPQPQPQPMQPQPMPMQPPQQPQQPQPMQPMQPQPQPTQPMQPQPQ